MIGSGSASPREAADSPPGAMGAAAWARPLALLAVTLAGALLFSRLLYIDWAPFIRDEPEFLRAAERQLATGAWATHSPLVGSSGVLYGPTPLWFYGVVQALVGSVAERCILVVALIVSVSELALVVVLARSLSSSHKREARSQHSLWIAACLLAFAAASPFEIFWSRLAWDLFTNWIPFVGMALLMAETVTPRRGALFGALMGLGISAHPMITPFAAIGLTSVIRSFDGEPRRKRRNVAVVLGCIALPNLPWLAYLASFFFQLIVHGPAARPAAQEASHAAPAVARPAFDVIMEVGRFLATFQPHSIAGFDYFFDDEWSAFATEHPLLSSKALQISSLCLVSVSTVAGLWLLRRNAHAGLRRAARVGLTCALVYPIFYLVLRRDPHPHYQFPVAWLAVVGAAGLLCATGRWRWAARAAVALVILVNLAFDVAGIDFIARGTGTHGIHYGTPVGEQRVFVEALCGLPERDLVVANDTAMFEYPLYQHFESNARCRGHTLTVCRAGECPVPPEGGRVVRLEYLRAQGGALRRLAH